jgi:secondary thiamine-phosphate synthase enzyme
METLLPSSTCHHVIVRIPTARPTEFIDVTDRIDQILGQTGILFGIVNIQALHTTTAVVVNEHEPLLLADFAALLERAASQHSAYRHDDPAIRTVNVTLEERINGHAHCRALMLGSSACLNIAGGRLRLGQWQRVFLVELDGPREREVSIMVLGGACR